MVSRIYQVEGVTSSNGHRYTERRFVAADGIADAVDKFVALPANATTVWDITMVKVVPERIAAIAYAVARDLSI